MTRYYPNKKQNALYLKKMTMSFFTRYGYLRGSMTQRDGVHIWKLGNEDNGSIGFSISRDNETGKGTLRVQFSKIVNQGENNSFDYEIRLVATPCHYGGLRWWFLDPCDALERKCSVLYLQSNGYFASQKLLNLSYDTQNEGRGVKRAEFQSIRGLVLYNKIKYKYRNGRATRKMRRTIKYLSGGLSAKNYTAEDIVKSYFKGNNVPTM